MWQEYVDAGFRVFGLYGSNGGGQCECGNPMCDALYKHPRVKAWQKTPRWSQDQLDCMDDSGQFATGFGVLCRDHLIIDVDPRNGGAKSLKRLSADLGVDLTQDAGLVVSTGGGGWHLYYRLEHDQALVSSLQDYPGIDFKSSGFVVGYGSMHASGMQYDIERGDIERLGPPPALLLSWLAKPQHHRVEINGEPRDVTSNDLKTLLDWIPNSNTTDYEIWIRVGMALHHCTGGDEDGYALWMAWSERSSKHDPAMMDRKWHSFGKSASLVTFGTLRFMAEEAGYVEPVTFTESEGPLPGSDKIDLSHVDIYRPPGVAGKITDYINSQCRYPRERLAAMAALVALGNIAGLKYQCRDYGVTTNLFAFCVAGSATGKEAVMQAMQEVMRAASPKLRSIGSIKSEQEIIRTLVEHPVACYVIDEIGYMLKKIKNAQDKGNAAYLEAVIGMLMSVYSKADAKLSIGAEQLKDAVKLLKTELASMEQVKAENERVDEERLADLQVLLRSLHHGYIDKPFLSLIGFTTPVTFDASVDYENATNGFFGRALIIREPDTNPRAKRRFRASEMPSGLRFALAGIFANSQFGMERQQVPTTGDAMVLLERIQDELHDLAEECKQEGLEAIPRRTFEQVLKISLICSIGEDVRDIQHVEYAYALAMADLRYKTNLAASNRAAEDKQRDEELLRKILAACDAEHGITTGVLVNKLRKFQRDDVLQAIERLKDAGKLKLERPKPAKRGRPSERWILTG